MPNLNLQGFNWKHQPSSREKIIFVVVLAASLLFFLDTLWKPQSVKIHALKSELRTVELEADAVRKLIEATTVQLNKAVSETDKTQTMDSYVKKVVERKIVDVTEEVNSTADLMRSRGFAKKADIMKVQIGDRVEEGGFIKVPIAVEMKGRYTAVKDYFESLENIGRALVVDSFQMEKGQGKSNDLFVKIKTELYIPKA